MICSIKSGPNETEVNTHAEPKSEVQIQVNRQNGWTTENEQLRKSTVTAEVSQEPGDGLGTVKKVTQRAQKQEEERENRQECGSDEKVRGEEVKEDFSGNRVDLFWVSGATLMSHIPM